MMLHRRSFLHSLLALPTTSFSPLFAANTDKAAFNIGISESLVRGQMNPSAAPMLLQPMADVFSLPGKPTARFQLDHHIGLARRLQAHNLQLCIMTGIEFGWTRPQFDGLIPLATVFTSDIRLKACVLVRGESKAQTLQDLKNQSIALPKRLQQHNHIFLHQAIVKLGEQPQGFFNRGMTTSDVEEGIESVLDQKAAAVLVDFESWKTFQERKPGRSQKLRILAQSQPFPTSAVLSQRNGWTDQEVQQIQEILCAAHQKAFTRQILNFWRITKFVKYSEEYNQVVNDIVRDIPQPVSPVAFATE